MFKDFREYLDLLESRDDLIRIKKEVSTKYEIAAFIRKTSDIQGPALLFENVKGYRIPVAGGVYAARRRIAMALGCNEREMTKEYMKRETNLIPPKLVNDGPVKEKIITKDIDILKILPIVQHSERDVGPYITAGVQIGKAHDSDITNVSMHRMMIVDKDKITLEAPKARDIIRLVERAEEANKPIEVATVIGMDPAILMGSQALVPLGVNELEIAGGLRGAPVEVVRGETIDVNVPATAEIVIEGETIPHLRVEDGPFGEYQGTYSGTISVPVIKIKAITMRENPIYQTCLTGMPETENHTLIYLPITSLAYKVVQPICPEIKGINLTPGGTNRHHIVVSIKKRHDYEARNVILALLSANLGVKLAIVVDDDIDVFNLMDVEWAINTRVQADEDVIIIPRLKNAGALDPSAPGPAMSTKMGIDATVPLNEPRSKYDKVIVPGADKIDLSQYMKKK